MTNQNHLSIEDIAELADSSRSTVSRVINNHPNVSEKTRQRIWEVIQETKFQPNPVARALASNRTQIISVLLPHMVSDLFTDPFFPVILQAITHQANQMGYSIILGLTSKSFDVEDFYNNLFHNPLTDGYLIISAVFDDVLINHLNQQSKPYMVIGRPHPELESPHFIDIDNKGGAKLAVDYLALAGRQRIGIIKGREGLMSTVDRYTGYCQALEDAGIPFDRQLVTGFGEYTEAWGYEGMQTLLQHPIDAVFASSDTIAFGAMKAIQDAGLQIPDDIAVVGFDDIEKASLSSPPLTTIRQDVSMLGQIATQKLIAILDSEANSDHQILPVELAIRESV